MAQYNTKSLVYAQEKYDGGARTRPYFHAIVTLRNILQNFRLAPPVANMHFVDKHRRDIVWIRKIAIASRAQFGIASTSWLCERHTRNSERSSGSSENVVALAETI